MTAPHPNLDPSYVAALTRLFLKVQGLLDGVAARQLPLKVLIAGGAAVMLHTSMRTSRDVDASFSLRLHLPEESLEEAWEDRAGNVHALYLDANYNDTFGPMHEDAWDDSQPLDLPGIDSHRLQVSMLTPVDLAISKLGRFAAHDQEDIAALSQAGLIDAAVFERRAREALSAYVGNVSVPMANLKDALRIVKSERPAPKEAGAKRRPKLSTD
jgi:hypothetical protein